jgi:lysophospholipase L1-like esterase
VARRIEAEIAARHDPSQCAVILVGVGINDSTSIISSGAGVVSPTEYTEALDTIRAVAARFNAKLGLIGLTPVHEKFVNPVPWLPTHAYTTARAHLFEQTRASYCARRKIPSVELWSSWLSYDWHSLLHDGLHPNTAGHDLNYRLIRPLLFDHFRVCDY